MLKFKLNQTKLLPLIIGLLVFVSLSQNLSAQTNSKTNSETVTVKKTVIDQCGKALDELDLRDELDAAKNDKIKLLEDRLESEKSKTALALELAESRKSQAESSKIASDAKSEAIAAKDAQLANKDKEIEILKKKPTKLITIMKAVGIGIGIGLVLK